MLKIFKKVSVLSFEVLAVMALILMFDKTDLFRFSILSMAFGYFLTALYEWILGLRVQNR